MVLHDGVREKQIEPVGVSILGCAQIGVSCFCGVCKGKLTGGLIVGGEKVVHLRIDTTIHLIGGLGIVQVSFLLEFLIDAHLVL